MPAPIWRELFGQGEAIAQLELAVKHREEGVHHAWLMTGPPGSGRSNLAVAFAGALLCADGGCGLITLLGCGDNLACRTT